MKSRLIGKDPDAEKDKGQEEKGATEDAVVAWHPQLSGYGFEQVPRDSEGQGSLACCSSRGREESDTTEGLNNNLPMGSPADAVGKTLPDSAGAARGVGSIPGSGSSPGGGNGNPSSVLAWETSWTGEPGGLQSTASESEEHDCAPEHTTCPLSCLPPGKHSSSLQVFIL